MLKILVRRTIVFLIVWCATGVAVAGLAGIEVLYWKARGWRFSLKSATERTVVRDFATNGRGKPIAMIVGHRTRGTANPLSAEVVVKGIADQPRRIQLAESIVPYRIALSKHNKVAILSRAGRIYLGDLGRGITPLQKRRDSRTQAALGDLVFSVDGKLLASQSEGAPAVWNTETRQQVSASWPKERSRVLCFFRDSRRILEATNTGVQIRDVLTGAIVHTIRTGFAASAAEVSASDDLALLCSSGYEVQMWNLSDGVALWQANSRAARRIHLAINGDRAFYMAANSQDVICCDATTGLKKRVVVSHSSSIHGMQLMDNMELLSWDVRGVAHKTPLPLAPAF